MPTASIKLRLFLLGQTVVRCRSWTRVRPPGCMTPVLSRCFNFICSNTRAMSTSATRTENKITVHFINKDGKRISVNSLTGVTLLEIVNTNLDFQGFGACEGTLACSTCHLIFEKAVYKNLGSIASEEMDMLDLTCGLTATSRLGCQVHVTEALDGMTVQVPEAVSDCVDIKTEDRHLPVNLPQCTKMK